MAAGQEARVKMGTLWLVAALVVVGVGVTYVVRSREKSKSLIPPADQVALSTTAESTARADELMGYSGSRTIRELEPLPELEEEEAKSQDVGSQLRPAVFLRFSMRPLSQVVDAYAEMWKLHSGAWEVLVEGAGGWRRVLDRHTDQTGRAACSIDIVQSVRLEDDASAAVRKLRAGCADLAHRLSATVDGSIDDKMVAASVERLARLRQEAGTALDIQLVAGDQSFRASDLHRVVRALGFVRSDFGSYAWYNQTEIGYDILITIRPAQEPFQFDFEQPSATYSGITLGFDLDEVPVPEVVLERLLTTLAILRSHLGGTIKDFAGAPLDEAGIRDRVRNSVAKLRGSGLLVQARAVEP